MLGIGDVAQLGERLSGRQEVRGSIPLISTNNNKDLRQPAQVLFLFMSAEHQPAAPFSGLLSESASVPVNKRYFPASPMYRTSTLASRFSLMSMQG